jgi:DNA-binding NtrC family response regulator
LITDTTLMDEHGDWGPTEGTPGLHLLVMSPDMFATHPLPSSGKLVVGRSASADIQVHDPLASRKHVVLHVGEMLSIEDLNSANGTRVRDIPIKPGVAIPVAPGEAIVIGGTCLMVQQNRAASGPRRLWSHAYFENRVEEECARASSAGSVFGVARIRVDRAAPWMRVVPPLVREIKPPHLLAAYGSNEYEVLFQGIDAAEATKLLESVVAGIAEAGHSAKFGLAWFPRDGRSPDALMARACGPLRSPPAAESAERVGPIHPAMQRVYEMAARAATGNINVLILGENGVGKEVLAEFVHKMSPRAEKRILCINCAALTENLLESELFGYERGAFTGAQKDKAGLLETAEGGTVFLDEIGEMPLPIQARLLRVIETRQVTRLGSVRTKTIDVRFLSATNRDLEAEVLRGTFRRDLFFRLNGISLTVPPLRDRVEEIPVYAKQFLANASREYARKPEPKISARAMELLKAYSWPGNIRELRNTIERAVVLCTGFEIGTEHLPLEKMHPVVPAVHGEGEAGFTGGAIGKPHKEPGLQTLTPWSAEARANAETAPPPSPARPPLATDGSRTASSVNPSPISKAEEERHRIVEALAACAGNQSRAAKLLGMARRTFVTKLELYAIPRPQKNGGERELQIATDMNAEATPSIADRNKDFAD